MPSPDGMLSQDERKQIADAMQSRFTNAICPWCSSPNWEVGLVMATTTPVGPGGTTNLNGQIMPQVTLVSPCGYIASFSAAMMGIQI
ncbi:MAG TPA: hypothetical protein VHZ78_02645 [Rhizomicrobium sp.]|jgi:hypothetical protein|nr:hypothetical protein [Rhizomicrobium sp.]